MVPYINTLDGITLLLNGKPVHIPKEDKTHDLAIEGIEYGYDDNYFKDLVDSIKAKVEAACQVSDDMNYSGGIVTYEGKQLHGYAVDKLVSLVEAGKETGPLVQFLKKLELNPSNQTKENLYQFLEHGRIPLNSEGNFLVYKAVREDYKDIYSGTFDNNIGKTITMARNAVDDRRENTCSRGLHVCSYDYLPSFAHANGHVMVCEVSPADVVSIPSDYNNTKMRVCKYKVVGEVENYYKDNEDVLGDTETWDEEYELLGLVAGRWELITEGNNLQDLIEESEIALEETYEKVNILNANGVLVYWRGE